MNLHIKLFLLAFFLIPSSHIIYQGFQELGHHPIDQFSEKVIFMQANSLSKGNHKFGVTFDRSTHYPHGISYIMEFFIKLGLKGKESLRLIPFFFLSLTFIFLIAYISFSDTMNLIDKIFINLALLITFSSPGLLNWMGSIHTYGTTISLLLIFLCIFMKRKLKAVFFFFGFLMGWILYDYIPVSFLTVLSLRWVSHSEKANISRRKALFTSLREASHVLYGVAGALFLQIIQISLFYMSFKTAITDQVGAAAARMNISLLANKLNPDFYSYLISQDTIKLSHENLIFASLFTYAKHIYYFFHYFFHWWSFLLLLIIMITKCSLQFKIIYLQSGNSLYSSIFRISVFFLLVLFSSAVWCFLMPLHAHFHVFYTSRHFYISILTIFFSFPLWNKRVIETNTTY